ncbi:MAG: ATP-binding protein [Peptococcaceae bacterium]|nr:ATP-binding protein [Peptococcaceae bacterium]
MLGKSWPSYIVRCLLHSRNIFAEQASSRKSNGIDPMIRQSVFWDLAILQKLAAIKPSQLKTLIATRFSNSDDYDEDWTANWPEWDTGREIAEGKPSGFNELKTSLNAQQWLLAFRNQIIQKFLSGDSWSTPENFQILADFYRQAGCGILAEYAAFRVRDEGPVLEGIENPDSIMINNLFCQEREQAIIIKNTESFLKGYPANNIILYGSRGTGKSSLVKALLNEYVAQGLRLIQLRKNQIKYFPEIARNLENSCLKFIFFIDDLSFSEEDNDYRDVKSLLEGGIAARPQNVLIYVTTNRRHFVKESFSERCNDDVHAMDNIDEKLSLADRFGITVTFLSPDQESYLKIVEGLAQQSGIEIDQQLLRQRALEWVMMHNSRSGRTAKQFIDSLKAELAENITENV